VKQENSTGTSVPADRTSPVRHKQGTATKAANAAAYKATIPQEIQEKFQDKLVIRIMVVMSKLGGLREEKPERPVALDLAISFLANAPTCGFYVASVYFEDGSELVFHANGFEREKRRG